MATAQPLGTDLPTREETLAETDLVKKQPLSAQNERSVSPNCSQDDAATGCRKEAAGQSGAINAVGDGAACPPNSFAHQAQPFYYRGYDKAAGEWDDYLPYVNAECLEIGSPGIYNDNPSLIFHSGYGYGPQMPYGPYSPVTTPLPSLGADPQLYQQFPYSGQPYYQQLVAPSMSYISSPTSASQSDLSTLVTVDQQSDGMFFGLRSAYAPTGGSVNRGNFNRNPWSVGFHDLQQGLDGLRSGGIWSNWSKPADRQRSYTPLSPAVSPQPIGAGSFGQHIGIASDHQRPLTVFGFGSGSDPYSRDYVHSGTNQISTFGSISNPGLGMDGRGWFLSDEKRCHWKGAGSLCNCTGTTDLLTEQNRGPRASKPKYQNAAERGSSIDDDKLGICSTKIHNAPFNCQDFVTEYKDAKFFVIKSYSEDNIHKSIKYGVWASTPNGNRKLDAAYQEAREKGDPCPVFLLFSVNASAQFCGVAEMVGPVDFNRSFDYWQQDKWSGQFPVKWHIIKDVPNSHFRHIVLENNDHKPVTNSRDTQEVKMEQGIEMLSIFKNYESDTSILDDFEFYEERQKVIQEAKARQQAGLAAAAVGAVGRSEQSNTVILGNDFINKMSKSFAHAVHLEEGSKEGKVGEAVASAQDGSLGTLEDMSVSTSTQQS